MSIFDNLKFLNPFSAPFKSNKTLEDRIIKQLEDNSQGQDVTEYDLNAMGMGSAVVGAGYSSITTQAIDFNTIFTNKKLRIAKYREMSYYPEISEGIDAICDDGIVQDPEGKILHLNIKKEFPKQVRKICLDEFVDYSENVLKIDNMHGLFKKFVIEGELFIEWILNNKKNKIIGYKILPAFTTFPVYGKTGEIKGFLQSIIDDHGQEQMIPLESNQVSYVHWDQTGKNLLDIRGYLEGAIRVYNQLKSLEDSLIVYRLVRAPERRVWNIEVGRLPNQKAQEFIKGVIHKYKRNLTYKSSDGSVDSERNVQSLAEDFWFAKRDGQGTSVETLASGMNLGELDDVKLFMSKLYKSLKIPKTRWSPDVQPSNYTTGRDIDREELKFSLFVIRAQNMFKKLVKDGYMEQMKFKYKNDARMKKYILSSNFDIDFTQANFFKQIKDLELMETRLNILGTAIAYVTNTDEPNNPLSMELVLRKYFQMNDEEYSLNERLKQKERDLNLKIKDEFGASDDEEDGGKDSKGGDSEGGKPKTSGSNPDGLGGGLGGGLSSPEKGVGPEEPKDDKKKEEESAGTHISKKAVDFLKKPRKIKKLL